MRPKRLYDKPGHGPMRKPFSQARASRDEEGGGPCVGFGGGACHDGSGGGGSSGCFGPARIADVSGLKGGCGDAQCGIADREVSDGASGPMRVAELDAPCPIAERADVTAGVHEPGGYVGPAEQRHDLINDEALGDGAQVKLGIRVLADHERALDPDGRPATGSGERRRVKGAVGGPPDSKGRREKPTEAQGRVERAVRGPGVESSDFAIGLEARKLV